MSNAGVLTHDRSLEPFFGLASPADDPSSWVVTPGPASHNQMGTVHGGAMCLMAGEIASRTVRRASGRRFEAKSLFIGFLRRADGKLDVQVEIDEVNDAMTVVLHVDRDGKRCAEVQLVGTADDPIPTTPGEEMEIDPLLAPGSAPSSSGPPFRDQMGVRLDIVTPRHLVATWQPSDVIARFAAPSSRKIGIAALLTDTGGTLVNSDAAGGLRSRYVTTSLAVTLLAGAAQAIRGPADVHEIGDGSSVRFTGATLRGSDGRVSGRGMAQFVAVKRSGTP